MKVLVRALIILLAAGIVAGGTLGLMQLPAVQSWITSMGGEQHGPPGDIANPSEFQPATAAGEDGGTTTAPAPAETGAPREGGRGGHNGGNLLGLVEVAKNLGIVAAVSLALAGAGWAIRRVQPRRHAPVAGTAG